ncbi:hypothetical protein OG698_17280 [Streptomyces sp. NBC_01003]|uniref:hypothetical protein n=1 Tax=Streptomyces sp. NBC_01003 TaxID=2903714 RepID=UPI00386A5C35|nr:hypothetical protein OG698_17280 [Streptomyces sp. NBC_01003]
MAWDEWEQLKADALAQRQQQDPRMQLNSAPSGRRPGGGGDQDLKTDPTGKKAAVKALEEEIRPGTDKAGDGARNASATAAQTFSGWATSEGLADAHKEWELQVANLKGRLDSDQTALTKTQGEFLNVDHGVEGQIAQVDPGRAPRREI